MLRCLPGGALRLRCVIYSRPPAFVFGASFCITKHSRDRSFRECLRRQMGFGTEMPLQVIWRKKRILRRPKEIVSL